MLISILIPVHNKLEVTQTGLASLYEALDYYENISTGNVKYEVVVIDDGSTDSSSNWIRKNYPQVHVLKGDGNLWWVGAINKGANYAINQLKTDFVTLWNNDVLPKQDYYSILSKKILSGTSQIIGSVIYNHESGKIWSRGGRFNILTGKRTLIPDKIKKTSYTYEWLPGMGTTIPGSVVKRIGYWDHENFPQYHGDFDFTIKANKAGIPIVIDNNLELFNITKYSSYKGNNIKTFFKSFGKDNLRSRYNLSKDIKIYRRHCIGYLWILALLKKDVIYFYETFISNTSY